MRPEPELEPKAELGLELGLDVEPELELELEPKLELGLELKLSLSMQEGRQICVFRSYLNFCVFWVLCLFRVSCPNAGTVVRVRCYIEARVSSKAYPDTSSK